MTWLAVLILFGLMALVMIVVAIAIAEFTKDRDESDRP